MYWVRTPPPHCLPTWPPTSENPARSQVRGGTLPHSSNCTHALFGVPRCEGSSSFCWSWGRQHACPSAQTSKRAIMWKATADCLAPLLHKQLQSSWCDQLCTLPQDWHRAILWLMAKPGKAPREPSALRPISLPHPVCKVLTGLALTKPDKNSLVSARRCRALRTFLADQARIVC